MKKQKFKLYDILNLYIELYGFIDPRTKEVKVEGLLNQNINHNTKYRLKSSANKISEEKSIIDSINNELIQKYGNEDKNGNVGLNIFLDEVDEQGQNIINPNYLTYQEEYNKFLDENEKEIEFIELTLDDLKDIKTKDNYRLIDEYFIIKEPTE
jgi:hypothetical protein